ncbi:MAG TPA: hypothetical protein VFG39_01400 [Balneolaceae bacterium]|nr:hypothetical protein [Balneolaceae bacterium]
MSTIVLKKSEDIDKLKSKMESARKEIQGLDAKKYSGVIQLKEDPVKYQKRIREEWNGKSD